MMPITVGWTVFKLQTYKIHDNARRAKSMLKLFHGISFLFTSQKVPFRLIGLPSNFSCKFKYFVIYIPFTNFKLPKPPKFLPSVDEL